MSNLRHEKHLLAALGLFFILAALLFVQLRTDGGGRGDFKEMSLDSFKSVMDAPLGRRVVYVGSEACGACRGFSPIVSKVSQESGVLVEYVDIDKYGANSKVIDDYDLDTVPMLVTVKDQDVQVYRGALSEKETVAIFKAQSDE